MLNQEFRTVKRGKPFTEDEKLLLYQCMLPDLEIIDSKAMDSISVVRKGEAWRRVTVKFNSHPNVCQQRTIEQLKKCFENAKCRKQWVVPTDSGTGILQHAAQININNRTASATTFSKFFQNKINGMADIPENALSDFRAYEAVHSNVEQRLDAGNIKCELVDIADGPDDLPEDTTETSAVEETHGQSTVTHFVDEHSDYTGQQALLEQRLTSNSEDICEDLEDVTGTIFLDHSIYQSAEVQRLPSSRKRPRRRTEASQIDGDVSSDDAATKAARISHIEELEERLLKAQVREAEAAASAAEVQHQLNQLALQHSQAEEVRRKQLHALRVRRLTQLVRDPHAENS